MKAIFQKEQTVNETHQVAKILGEKKVLLEDIETSEVEDLIRLSGNKIGNVHFVKRTGKKDLRKMCYRLHVKNPTNANKPKGKGNRKGVNKKNNQMTVFDVNKVLRDKNGDVKHDENGKQLRGAWRTVPLENVVRVCADGVEYIIQD